LERKDVIIKFERVKNFMTQRTFTTKSGTTFEWEETEELVKAVQELHKKNENATKS
jgi:hypothetical protein